MSFDYSVVAKGPKRSAKKMRALVQKIALLAADDEDNDELDDEDFDFLFDGRGSIQIRRLAKGYQLSVDSNSDGNRDNWDDICELANQIAAALGEIVADDVAAAMIQATDEPPAAKAAPASDALASKAIVELFDIDGRVIETVRVHLPHFADMLDIHDMPSRPHPKRPSPLDEEHRYGVRASRMVATLHLADGRAHRRYTWPLDGYGRIKSVSVDEL